MSGSGLLEPGANLVQLLQVLADTDAHDALVHLALARADVALADRLGARAADDTQGAEHDQREELKALLHGCTTRVTRFA